MSTRGTQAQALAATAFRLREFGILVALLATGLFFTLRATNFLTGDNLQDIGTNVAIVIVVAVGQTMVILTRNIDLSVGSIVGLTAVITAQTLAHHHGLSLWVAALLAVAVGTACGLANGLLVAVARVPAIIATLATLSIYRGLVFQRAHGVTINQSDLPNGFLDLATRKVLGTPFLLFVAVVVVVLGSAFLHWTSSGRDFYAIGSNPAAARFAGIAVTRRVILALTLSGALAGLGGFMWAARFGTLNAVSASGFEFDVITAAVIGGVNVFGGSGTVLGAVIGALLVGTIANGFTLLRISEFWKITFQGFAIVVAVTIDALVTQRLQEALRRRRRREVAEARAEAKESPA